MATAIIEAVSAGLTAVINWISTVVTSLTATTGGLSGLLPLLGISIAISALLLSFKVIYGMIWGR